MRVPNVFKTQAGERELMALYDVVLSRWPVPAQLCLVPTRHGDTFVVAGGPEDAAPLVLLHGAGSNSAAWAGDFAELSRERRVYALDVIGDPGRSARERPPYDGPAYADWLADVLDGLGVGRTALAGMSQGGWVALKFAVSRPERVAVLVLLSPAGVTTDRASFLFRALFLSLFGPVGLRRLNRVVAGGCDIGPEAERFMDLALRETNARFEALVPFTDGDLSRLTMPVLLLGGGKDVIRDVGKIGERLARFLPALMTEIDPKEGHVLIRKAGKVLAFLDKQSC